ncbi:uncharacterized protein LOC120148392 [Hibiscus syriacus]|nr:uncharacterized protein LOC120148392 [Hibiscus syriacus]
MSTILKDSRKFDSCIQQVEHSHPSGANQQIILQRVSELFVQERGFAFKFDHVFDLVKDILQLEKTSAVYSLPPEKISDSVNPSLSSFKINLSNDENISTGGSSSQRPEGVKKSKAKRKQIEEDYVLANSFNESTKKLREALSLSNAQRDIALQLEKERIEAINRRSEFAQLRREDKILAMDPDTISDPERHHYFRNEQQKIIRKRKEEEQSTSTTFNVFGMNFDDLGGSGGGLSDY